MGGGGEKGRPPGAKILHFPDEPLFASNSKLSFPYGVMQVKQQRIVANKNKGVCLTPLHFPLPYNEPSVVAASELSSLQSVVTQVKQQ